MKPLLTEIGLYSRVESVHRAMRADDRNGRTDVEIFLPDAPNIEIDFSVVCPIAPSYVKKVACARVDGECFHAWVDGKTTCGSADSLLQKVESEKDNLHLGPCARKGNIFFPCAVTSFGQFGSRSRRLIGKLAGRACQRYPEDWKTPGMWARHFKTTIAFQLHRGNARMVDDGFNRLLASNGIVDTRPAAMRSRRARGTRPPDRFRDSFRGGNHHGGSSWCT